MHIYRIAEITNHHVDDPSAFIVNRIIANPYDGWLYCLISSVGYHRVLCNCVTARQWP